jgi:hypothetical protein
MERGDEAVERIGARLVERLERVPTTSSAIWIAGTLSGVGVSRAVARLRSLSHPGSPGDPQVVVDLVDRQPPPQDRGSLLC